MAPRTFWMVLVKISGLYIIIQALNSLPNILFSIVFTFGTLANNPFGLTSVIYQSVYLLGFVAFYAAAFYYCIFKTDWIINKLKLDQGFIDERFEFSMHRSSILKIAVIIVGGVLLIDGLPLFCQNLLTYLQQSQSMGYNKFTDSPQAKVIIIYFIKSFIGFFMITCSRMIVNFIELKRKYPTQVTEE